MKARPPMLRHLFVAALACGLTATAACGEFVINPLRVTLDRNAKSSEIVVRNDDTAPLRMQVEGMSWTQDADGRDQYAPAEGLVFFPRAMELAPGESRVVRVGVRAAPVTREETYRLFMEELPGPPDASARPADGATLRVYLRVGVGVFVAPAQPERAAAITKFALSGGKADITVANTGNVHIRAEQFELVGTDARGERVLVQPVQERYVLAGVTKTMAVPIPPDVCRQLVTLEAVVVGERLDLKRKLDVAPGNCS
ncbi:MAG: fimbria/pilus periplasmic chaperone [Burkholderiales bacterium]